MRSQIKFRINSYHTFPQSSNILFDPYVSDANLVTKLKGRLESFKSIRQIEKNFKDFRLFNLQTQVKEIHSDLYLAQRRKDRVTMQRSLSDQLYS